MTKKQLQDKVKRLERKNRQLEKNVDVLGATLLQSLKLAKDLSRMIPPPNYNFAEGV